MQFEAKGSEHESIDRCEDHNVRGYKTSNKLVFIGSTVSCNREILVMETRKKGTAAGPFWSKNEGRPADGRPAVG